MEILGKKRESGIATDRGKAGWSRAPLELIAPLTLPPQRPRRERPRREATKRNRRRGGSADRGRGRGGGKRKLILHRRESARARSTWRAARRCRARPRLVTPAWARGVCSTSPLVLEVEGRARHGRSAARLVAEHLYRGVGVA
jgi:hypothetical protein